MVPSLCPEGSAAREHAPSVSTNDTMRVLVLRWVPIKSPLIDALLFVGCFLRR